MTALLAPPTEPTAQHGAVRGGGRASLLLDVLIGLSLLAGLSWTLTMALDPRLPIGLTVGYLALVVAMAAIWAARRVRERRSSHLPRAWVVVFATLGTAGLFVADGAGAWPLFLMALLWLVDCFGPRSGVVLVVIVLVLQLVAFVITGHSARDTVMQVAGSAYVFAFGLVLAWLLTEHVRQRQQIAGLLADVRHGMSAEVELVLADERTRAARDLHDGLGHRLTLIGMALDFAQRMRNRDADRAWEQVDRARSEAGEALTTMRRWVRALNPVRVEGASLATALDAVAESFRGTGLEVSVNGGPMALGAHDEPELDHAATLFVHRFVQEGLTNALRHSAATRVEVSYRVHGGALVLGVTDNGTPDAPERPGPSPGFGLRTLSERAAELGGSLTVAWSDSGLSVSAELPVTAGRTPR
jgi:signal transduction histidine kinase